MNAEGIRNTSLNLRTEALSRWLAILSTLILTTGLGRGVTPEEIEQALSVIHRVGPQGQGNAAASAAWKTLVGADGNQLRLILEGMDGANAQAANWLRAAVETIVERQLAAGGELPLIDLGPFLLDPGHHPGARQLAFEFLRKHDPKSAAELLPGMLNDSSLALRREAVQQLTRKADSFLSRSNLLGAGLLYRQALIYARDIDQIQSATKRLRGLGQEVDLPRLFGFLVQWKVIGPFHNDQGAGFDTVFPPETAIDLTASYEGKGGRVQWKDFASTNDYGKIDINQVYGMLKEVTAYAYTEFFSDQARPAELRLGCKNGWKVWLNGRLLFGRDEYHRGARIDQYRMPGQLQPGRNTILVKVCQNELREDWTVEWEFQLRVCDALGTPINPAAPPSFAPSAQVETGRKE